MRALLEKRPDLDRARLERTRDLMNSAVLDCLVTGYEDLIEVVALPDPHDRHVLAAAIRGRADVIVTFNLRHFPSGILDRYGIDAQHPDAFVTHLLDLAPTTVYRAVKRHREALKNPPCTAETLLDTLQKQGLAQSVARLYKAIDLL